MTGHGGAPSAPASRHVAPWAAVGLVYRVVRRQLFTKGRVIALTLLALLAPIAAFAVGSSDRATLEDAVRLLASLGFAVVIPVVALVFGSAALGDLRDDKTLVYLWLRPIDRWPIVLGATLAALTFVAPITLVPVIAAAAFTGAGHGIVSGTVIAGVVGVVAYVAVFTCAGVLLKRSTVWGLAYILIWEGFIAQGSPGVARFALRKYTRSILVARTGVQLKVADFSLAVGVIVPLLVSVGAVALASWRLARLDVD